MDANVKIQGLMANKVCRADQNSGMWYDRASLYRVWKIGKEMKKVTKFLNVAQGELPLEALNKACGALWYDPKASKKALAAVANSAGSSPREVKTVFGRLFRFR